MTFEDHYSGHAEAYARYRPRYPDAIFSWLASVAAERRLAWDAGTGNGQVAIALAEHFERVVATDASADQIERAIPHERIVYRAEPSDRASLSTASVDLITAGAAAHWFDLEPFYREVLRVAKPGAIVALFSYGPRDVADAFGPIVHHFQEEILGPFWPERIQLVHARYATLDFPFEEIAFPPFVMEIAWNLGELLQFLETWSASQRYLQQTGTRATATIASELSLAWGDPAVRRRVECPIFARVGRV